MPALPNVRAPQAWLALAALTAAGIAYAGAAWPPVFGLVIVCFALALTAILAYRWPRHMLLAAPALVFLAGTKFRARDARASLALEIDAQILLELGLYGALGAGLLAVVASRFVPLNRPGPFELLLVAFAGVIVASLLWTTAPALAAARAVQLILLLFWALLAVRALTNAETLLSVGVGVTVWVLLFSGLAMVMPPLTYEGPVEFARFFWFSMHPIQCATFAAIAMIFVASYALLADDRKAGLRMVGAVACGMALLIVVLATRSRGPFVALATALAALLALRFLRTWRAPFAMAVAAAAALYYINVGLSLSDLLTATTGTDNQVVAFLIRNQSAEQLASLTGRADLWSLAIELIRERPLFGHGYQSSRGLLLDDFSWASYAHNAFLQVLLEIGLVGGALLIVSVLMAVAITLRNRWQRVLTWERGFLGATLVFLVINASTSESFAAAPGIELMLLFVCVLLSSPVAAAEALRSRSIAGRGALHRARRLTTFPTAHSIRS